MGKNRILGLQRYLSVFLCWFISGAFAQAATFTVNSPLDAAAPATVLIRARGPSISGAPFFVPGTLANPFLQIFSGQDVIAQNDNWQDTPSCSGFVCGTAAQIAATGLDPCQPNPGQTTPPPSCTQESAILATLPPVLIPQSSAASVVPQASGWWRLSRWIKRRLSCLPFVRRPARLPEVHPTDAVNMSQFSGLANDVSALRSDIGNVASSAYRGIAGVAALTSGTPATPGKTSINLGVGAYKGYAADGITASHTTENGSFNLNGGVGVTSGEPVYRAGVGFSF